MHGVAISRNSRDADLAMLVGEGLGLTDSCGAAAGRLAECGGGVSHFERDIVDAVAMRADLPRDGIGGIERSSEDKADLFLHDEKGGAIARAGLGSAIRGQFH